MLDPRRVATLLRSTDAIANMVTASAEELLELQLARQRALPEPDLFEEVLRRASNLEATNARDHVYGILGLTGCHATAAPTTTGESETEKMPLSLRIDYDRSVVGILQDATKWVLNRDRSLAAVRTIPHERAASHSCCAGRAPPLPSWTICWSCVGERVPPDFAHDRFRILEHPQNHYSGGLEFQDVSDDGTIRFAGQHMGELLSFEDRSISIESHLTLTLKYAKLEQGWHRLKATAISSENDLTSVRWGGGVTVLFSPNGFNPPIRPAPPCTDARYTPSCHLSRYSKVQISNREALLKRAQPGDILVLPVRTPGDMVCLRPTSNGQFLFVCICDARWGMASLLGPDWELVRCGGRASILDNIAFQIAHGAGSRQYVVC